MNICSVTKADAGDFTICPGAEVDYLTLDNCQALGGIEFSLHCLPIQDTIRLHSGALNRWPLPTIEQAKLDCRLIGDAPHQTIERIDLSNEMTFPQSAHRRVTRHHPKIVPPECHQCNRRTHTPRCMCRLATRVTATNDDNVKLRMFHVKHLFAQTERREHFVQNLLNINPADYSL